MKAKVAVVFVIMLLLLSLPALSCVVASSSQVSAYRFDAQGGIPGPPEKKPKPPEEVAIEYELFIEIDYMEGHEPNSTVLDYVHTYYLERGINVTFYKNDVVRLDTSVSDTEFWDIEETYNDNDHGYYSKWKWFLYGTTVEGYPNVVGYIYANEETGNYGFIAEVTSSEWAISEELETWSSEAVVLMHELGHAIGILKLNAFGEMYDKNTESVMSYLNINNADNYWTWFYSKSYWNQRDMEYYTI